MRIQELLLAEHGIDLAYSTLTRLIREQDLRRASLRCRQFGEVVANAFGNVRAPAAQPSIPLFAGNLISIARSFRT